MKLAIDIVALLVLGAIMPLVAALSYVLTREIVREARADHRNRR